MDGLSFRVLRRVAAAVLACLLAWPAAAQPIRVGCVEFPPLTYTDAQGRPAGTAVELIAAILRRAGLEYEIKCYPGARLLASLRDGTAEVAMLIRHPDLLSVVQYGGLPMAHLDLQAYRLAATPPLGGIENSRGKSLVLLRGYGYGGWIDFFTNPDNGLRLSYADSRAAALRMLANGHGAYLVDYAGPAGQALNGTAEPQLRVEPLVRLETYFVVSNQAANPTALLRRIEDIFTEMGAVPVN